MLRTDYARTRWIQATRASLDACAVRLKEARTRHQAFHPASVLERRVEAVANLRARFEKSGQKGIDQKAERLVRLGGLLRTLGPVSAFQRGFSITLGPNGKIVTSAATLKAGDLMRTKFADGETLSTVNP